MHTLLDWHFCRFLEWHILWSWKYKYLKRVVTWSLRSTQKELRAFLSCCFRISGKYAKHGKFQEVSFRFLSLKNIDFFLFWSVLYSYFSTKLDRVFLRRFKRCLTIMFPSLLATSTLLFILLLGLSFLRKKIKKIISVIYRSICCISTTSNSFRCISYLDINCLVDSR